MKIQSLLGLLILGLVCIGTDTLLAQQKQSRKRKETSEQKVSEQKLSELRIGDRLPAIGNRVTWIKGKKVETFEKGKVYVIDMWATWCGPCIKMMPHTSDIADRYAKHGVTVIGLALDPRGGTPTKDFTEKNRDKMRYTVCEDIDQQMSQEYMRRIGLRGIPSILIVNQDGVLAWKGHPKAMGGPLAEVVLKTYDLVAAKKEFGKEKKASAGRGRSRGAGLDRGSLVKFLAKRDGDQILKLTEPMLKNKASIVNTLGIRAKGFYFNDDYEKCIETYKQILKEEGHFKTQVICGAAEFLTVEYESNPARNLKDALFFAEKALSNKGGQPWLPKGSLVFVLDVVDVYLEGNPKDEIKDYEFFSNKLKQYKKLRVSRPKESGSTKLNRRKIFGK